MPIATKSPPIPSVYVPNAGRWHALAGTFLGECFDALDVSIYFIALYPALSELLHTKDATIIGWHGAFILTTFMVGWSVGSVLLGFVADRLGRIRTLAGSIILYAIATGLCATCHSWQEFAFYRFLVGLGIGGEMGVGTVVLSEYWHGRARAWAMAVMQTSFGAGCILTALFNMGTGILGWRFLFLMGLLPALVAFYIQAKLPETRTFSDLKEKRQRLAKKIPGSLEPDEQLLFINPFRLIFNANHRTQTILATLIMSSAITGYWAAATWLSAWINQLTGSVAVSERSASIMYMGIGGIVGTFATPLLIKYFGHKKSLYLGFLATLASTLAVFLGIKSYSPAVDAGSFAIGFCSYISYLAGSLYVVASFPTNLLGTASGVAWGTGRAVVALMGLCMGPLIAYFHGSYALTAAALAPVSLVGLVAACFVEEAIDTSDSSMVDF